MPLLCVMIERDKLRVNQKMKTKKNKLFFMYVQQIYMMKKKKKPDKETESIFYYGWTI